MNKPFDIIDILLMLLPFGLAILATIFIKANANILSWDEGTRAAIIFMAVLAFWMGPLVRRAP